MEVTRVLIADMPGPAWWEFWMQWAGLSVGAVAAVGTLGAVYVALSRNNQTDRLRARQDMERASLYAASIEVRLQRFLQILENVQASGLFAQEKKFQIFKEKLESAAHDITPSELLNLVPMGKGTAHRIARGLGKVSALRHSVEAAYAYGVYSQDDPVVSDSQTTNFAMELGEAINFLKVSLAHCVDVADYYAKTPSSEELYENFPPDD